MTGLAGVLALAAALPAGCVAVYGVKATSAPAGLRRSLTAAAILILVAATVAGYGALGRFSDWNVRVADDLTDWQLASRLTEARRTVKDRAEDPAARVRLARVEYEAGRYADAVKTAEAAIALGAGLEAWSLKAEALYYREGRRMTDEAKAAVDRVLAANPLDVSMRLLIANDAFLNERYADAIREWQLLIRSGAAYGRERALQNAIANAQRRLEMRSSETNQ